MEASHLTLPSIKFSDTIKNENDKSKEKVYSSGSLVKALGTKTLVTGLFMCKNWELSIDFKLTNQFTKKWNNLFSLQSGPWTSQNHGFVDFESADQTSGSYIPAVWVQTDKSSVMIMISYNINNNSNFIYNVTTKFGIGNWINLRIGQINGLYAIKVDYKQVYKVTNSLTKKWRDVNLVMGNTYGAKYISAIGHYRNFNIMTCAQTRKIMKTYCL